MSLRFLQAFKARTHENIEFTTKSDKTFFDIPIVTIRDRRYSIVNEYNNRKGNSVKKAFMIVYLTKIV